MLAACYPKGEWVAPFPELGSSLLLFEFVFLSMKDLQLVILILRLPEFP